MSTNRRSLSKEETVTLKKSILSAAMLLGMATSALAQISGDVVRIGVLTDMAGPYSDNLGAGSLLAAQMAVEDFGGKVNGKPIEILSADHQNKADLGSSLARGWFDVDGVDVITELGSSAVALAVQELARERNRLALHTGAGTPDLTGKACSPVGIQWSYDNYAYGNVVATTMIERGLTKWFFITADYAFGHSLEASASQFVNAAGGEIIGTARHPLNNADFSSLLLQAQSSGAQVVALANAGADMSTALKQANEFGLAQAGQELVSLMINLPDVHAMGLENSQGLVFTEGFYWDMNEEVRAWSERFKERFNGRPPASLQASVYEAVMHYLQAVEKTGTDDATIVAQQMRDTPINGFYTKNGYIREDGRVIRDMYLFQVKSPEESKESWDYYKTLATIPGEKAFRPLADGGCPLVKAD